MIRDTVTEKESMKAGDRKEEPEIRAPRIMLTAPASGSGKTLLACGLLQAFKARGLRVAAFKCGPDYIDPMFHRKVLGIPSYNLDTFLCGKNGVRETFAQYGYSADIAVLEGVMGYYDGLAGVSTDASAYDIAATTDTPAILIVDCKGISVSVVPYIQGFLHYRQDSRIAGVILNRLSPSMYGRMREMVERETGTKVYGYVPVMKDCVLESRHLGLKMPEEIEKFRQKVEKLGRQMEETIEIDELLELAGHAAKEPEYTVGTMKDVAGRPGNSLERTKYAIKASNPVVHEGMTLGEAKRKYQGLRIGLASDQAFCFYYQENLDLLRERGAQLIPFSPVSDLHLPEHLDGLLLYGGYPELYAGELSRNESMRREVRLAVRQGLPCIAECGGFMYLQEGLTDEGGKTWPMAGALHGRSWYTSSLKRFGYVTLSGGTVFGQETGEIPAHEFHYFDSEECGSTFCAKKPLSQKNWKCMISTETLLAGYPHIHYRGNPKVAEAFLDACKRRKSGE